MTNGTFLRMTERYALIGVQFGTVLMRRHDKAQWHFQGGDETEILSELGPEVECSDEVWNQACSQYDEILA